MNLLIKLTAVSVAAMLAAGCINEYKNPPYVYVPRHHHVVVTKTYHRESRPSVEVYRAPHYGHRHHHRPPHKVRVHLHEVHAKKKPVTKKVVVTKKKKAQHETAGPGPRAAVVTRQVAE